MPRNSTKGPTMINPIRILILATFTLLFAACDGTTEPEPKVTAPTTRATVYPGDAPTKPAQANEASASAGA